jgi:DNA-binding transcriptional regulator YiaG
MDGVEFSVMVKRAREQTGISQAELAHALNVSYVTVNRWENLKTEPHKLAKATFFAFCEQKGINIKEEK